MEILQIHYGELHSERKKCIDSVRSVYKNNKYLMIRGESHGSVELDVIHSDWERMKLLSENPYMLYIDTDIYVKKPFAFPLKGKPYMYDHGNNCIIYSNNCCGWFRQFGPSHPHYMKRIITTNMFSHVDVYKIPLGYADHIGGSGKEKHWHQIKANQNVKNLC